MKPFHYFLVVLLLAIGIGSQDFIRAVFSATIPSFASQIWQDESLESRIVAYQDNIIDPTQILQLDQQQNFGGTKPLVSISTPVLPVSSASKAGNTFTGKLLSAPSSKSGLFSYYLQLSDGEKLRIDSVHNFRESLGKNMTITIEGTKQNFRILSMSVGGQTIGKQAPRSALAQTGPAEILLFAGVLGLLGTLGIRRFYAFRMKFANSSFFM